MKKCFMVLIGILLFACAPKKQIVSNEISFDLSDECGGIYVAPDAQGCGEIEQNKKTILIHGMEGKYPKANIGKPLGDGLFTRQYEKIAGEIKSNGNSKSDISIIIVAKGNEYYSQNFTTEAKEFFINQSGFFIAGDEDTPQAIININIDDEQVSFSVKYKDFDIFETLAERDSIALFDGTFFSIEDAQKEALSKWSKITIQTNEGTEISKLIMKHPVLIGEYKNNDNKNDMTNITINDMDEYCTKQNGTVATVFFFEYAMREGKIAKPAVKNELIWAYSEDEDEDILLKREDDTLKSSNHNEITPANKFNHVVKKYTFQGDSYRSKSATFRCQKDME